MVQIPDTSRDDYDYVLKAVARVGLLLEAASDRLKDNDRIVKAAVSSNPEAFRFASERLRGSQEIVEIAVRLKPNLVTFTSDNFKASRDLLLGLVGVRYKVLEGVPDILKEDRSFMLRAITCNMNSFQYAAQSLKEDESFVLQAVKVNGEVLKFVSDRYKNEWKIVHTAVTNDGMALRHAPAALKRDQVIAISAITSKGDAFEYVSDILKSDRSFILQAVGVRGSILKVVHKEFQKDPEIVLSALWNNQYAIEYASDDLKLLKSAHLTKGKYLTYRGAMFETAYETYANLKAIIDCMGTNIISTLIRARLSALEKDLPSSRIYWTQGMLDFHNLINNELFYADATFSNNKFETLEEIFQKTNNREIVVVHLSADKKLQQMTKELKELLKGEKDLKRAYLTISEYIHRRMGGTQVSVQRCQDHIAHLKCSYPTGIPIGEITVGLCRHRAILFKVLCDSLRCTELPLLCKLLRGTLISNEGAGNHAWNVVIDNQGFYHLLDIMNNPSELFEEHSAQAKDYYEKVDYRTPHVHAQRGGKYDDIPIVIPEELELTDQIEIGGYARVVKANLHSREYAIKQITNSEIDSTEVLIMSYLKHDNIMSLVQHYRNKSKQLCLVMPLMDSDLYKLLSDPRKRSEITLLQKVEILLQVALGMEYLHRLSILHRDLKPQNILIKVNPETKSFFVKVADFGTSRVLRGAETNKTYSRGGTDGFCRHKHNGEHVITTYDDVYSFGETLAFVLLPVADFPKSQYSAEVFGHQELYELYVECTDRLPRIEFSGIVKRLEKFMIELLETHSISPYQYGL